MGSRGYLDYYIYSAWLVTTGSRVRVKFDAERRVSFVSYLKVVGTHCIILNM